MILIHGNVGSGPAARSGGVWALDLSGRPTWRALSPSGSAPLARSAHSAVHDAANDRVVVFGGTTPAFSDELWELNLQGRGAWRKLHAPEPRPTAREEHCAIYDPVHQVMILYGGVGSETQYLDDSLGLLDTWMLTLQGSPRWHRLPRPLDDYGSWGGRAVYDPIGQQMIVHGGWSRRGTLTLHLAALGAPITREKVADVGESAPRELPLRLAVRMPNPTRGALAMELALPTRGARLELFDVTGRRVAQRQLTDLGPGFVRYRWDATEQVPAGIYLMRLSVGQEKVKKKLILLR